MIRKYFNELRARITHHRKTAKLQSALKQTSGELQEHNHRFNSYGPGWWGRAQEIVERRQELQKQLHNHLNNGSYLSY